MFLPALPIVFALGSQLPEVVTSPRVAQVRLAEALGEAESIEAVAGKRHAVTFLIVRDGAAFDVTATTKRGEVVSLVIAPSRTAVTAQLHGLSWLGAELASATAVTRLIIDDDGAVTIVTDDGVRYMAIPGRGSGGNVVAEARWGAAWSSDDEHP
jgi:hypothetical protein